MSNDESISYGAIPTGGADDDVGFDERNLSYLEETSFSWSRCFRATFPVIIALFIMGFFAFGMGHGFDSLYGPPKESGDNIEIWKKVSGPECSVNSKCNALGLTGDCCPHMGVMLGCCDDN